MRADPVCPGLMIALNLRTQFLTPPFGFALFYLCGVAPTLVTTVQIWRGETPYRGLQVIILLIPAVFPATAAGLPFLFLQ